MDIRLVGLALGAFAIGIEGFVVASLLPQIAGDTGVTLVEAGYLVVTYAFAYAIGAPVVAALTGSLDRRFVLAAPLFSLPVPCLRPFRQPISCSWRRAC